MSPRILPTLDDLNRPFWTGGHDGQLLIEHCDECNRWQHPPVGRCETCGGPSGAKPVSGRGGVFTYTVNHHQYHPEVPPPYVIAIVELDEQRDLRVVANILEADDTDLAIGMRVRVEFENHDEHSVPVFVPER